MGEPALWLSHQEQVEVEIMLDREHNAAYQDPKFKVKRQDGTQTIVDRRDILLKKEVEMVNELAQILQQKQLKAKNERYADIMRYFLAKGVPFASRLQHQMTPKRQLDLFDDVG